ncbi:MAG TPA: 50S ribosomal protein L11 [Euryarchaeota archaeon]|nr:50S ribosomal protein L11 [archaeon BMS3Abin16]GBE57093.1 50S ribosomal protein L11 [archaeon BMS3Bbin16]HDH28379.1 50S ribosomal protein L11 [Euryarchaeota archaeon]HDY74846.1 50S ribosomal protein L11 [Euryarchaeota archaeon]
MTIKIDALVEGGKASAGPPLGPALGPAGVNIGQVVAKINEKTKAFAGMKVPVVVVVDPATKSFEIEVGTPPASALILKELGIDKGSGEARTTFVGDLTVEQAAKIAGMKKDSLLAASLKAAVMEISGTCVSMGVKLDGKPAKEFQAAVAKGDYDESFKGKEW